jgi:hypothetical protein
MPAGVSVDAVGTEHTLDPRLVHQLAAWYGAAYFSGILLKTMFATYTVQVRSPHQSAAPRILKTLKIMAADGI